MHRFRRLSYPYSRRGRPRKKSTMSDQAKKTPRIDHERNVLVIGDDEIDLDILDAVIDPKRRLLWAFVRKSDGRIQPVPFREEQVIWLEPGDLSFAEEIDKLKKDGE